jgi:transposase
MLDQGTREAILQLHAKGHGVRKIAREMRVSRDSVREVLARGTAEVPSLIRAEIAEPHRDQILELYNECKHNLVRVHEELSGRGVQISYQALTAFCRRHEIGHEPKLPSGRYEFAPGQEMQHDTSPHQAWIGGVLRKVQTAAVVLCYSELLYFQMYPRFTRFECKVVLTEACEYFGGSAKDCMIDNTHVIVLCGTGKDMIPVPEMVAFGERFGHAFKAHEKGDANRSARVEIPFYFIENNFLAGRRFDSWEHANREARLWCDKVNATYSTKLHASRRELYAAERFALRPLPLHVPEVYRLHQRIVDSEGYVNVARNRYSVPWKLIGRDLEVRETKSLIHVYQGPRIVASHLKVLDALDQRVTCRDHRPPRGQARPRNSVSAEEQELLRIEPALGAYIAALKAHAGGRGTLWLRRLLGLLRDFPRDSLLAAVSHALDFGLFDIDRLERLVLRHIARDYFVVADLPRDSPARPVDPSAQPAAEPEAPTDPDDPEEDNDNE